MSRGKIWQWNSGLVQNGFLNFFLLIPFQQFTNYLDTLYSPSLLFTKLSILLLILRIFCPSRDGFYWTIQSLNAVNTIFYALFMFINIFLCSPRRKIYDPFSPGRCLKIFELYITSATFNVVSDIAMFFVPLWRIWHLQISRKRKVGISAIFFTGALYVILLHIHLLNHRSQL